MNSFEAQQLGKFKHKERLTEGKEERLARQTPEEREKSRFGWVRNFVLFFL